MVLLFRSYLRDFNLIKLLLEIKSSFLSCKITSSLNMWALKLDINLLNQHWKAADWLADLLRHFDSQSTQGTWVLKHLRHSRHSGARKALGHSGTHGSQGTRTLKKLVHLGTWGTQALKGYLVTWDNWDTQALEGHLGTRALKALEHSGSRKALGHSKDNWALGHSGHLRYFV